jgi:hypothetical protein
MVSGPRQNFSHKIGTSALRIGESYSAAKPYDGAKEFPDELALCEKPELWSGDKTVRLAMLVRANSEFAAVQCTNFTETGDIRAFRDSNFASLVVEPAGEIAMPPSRVVNRPSGDYNIHQPMRGPVEGKLPSVLDFPKMAITILENAYCLPFSPPILPARSQIVTDFLIPWAPRTLGWFDHDGGDLYRTKVDFDTDDTQCDLDLAFYMDHSISWHYGHFIGDCLCRMHAWEVCRSLFGDVKVIIADRADAEFQTHLLNAANVPTKDIVKVRGLVRCKRLLLATPSLGVERYASPTSARLWGTIRDRSAVRDVSLPDRIYLSRRKTKDRKLANENEVERLFERHGFTIVCPETLPVKQQIALACNARLIAGPGGSGMSNLAFQGRMRSAFILAWDKFLLLSEMLASAGRSCDLWYHLGRDVPPQTTAGEWGGWIVDLAELESNVADWCDEAGR